MTKEKPYQTLREKLFPTIAEARYYAQKRYDAKSATGIGIFAYRWMRSLALAGAILFGSYEAVNLGNNIEYSRGERTGMINKVSEKGLFWKTNENQMALEGIVSENNTAGANVWDFSLDREARHGENTQELVTKLREYMQNGTKVKVTYVQPLLTWPWRSETHYLIQDIGPVGNAEKQ